MRMAGEGCMLTLKKLTEPIQVHLGLKPMAGMAAGTITMCHTLT